VESGIPIMSCRSNNGIMDTGFAEEGIKTTVYAMHPRYTQRLSNTLHGVKKK